MKATYQISIYHDTRRPLKNGKYPVKLRVFSNTPRRQKLFATEFELTVDEFNESWGAEKPRGKRKELKQEITALEQQAIKAAKKLKPFTLDRFEKMLLRKTGDSTKLSYHFDLAIQDFTKHRQVSSAENYTMAEKSIRLFTEANRRKYDQVSLYDITPGWLQDYQQFMQDRGRKINTIGIYLRSLRAVFNRAIASNDFDSALYPFQRKAKDGNYQIPETTGNKRALSKADLATLYHAVPRTEKQQQAKDFFFFSYSCNGMNIKDIALLKYKNIQGDELVFHRAKTLKTQKKAKIIKANLNDFTRAVIEKHGSLDKSPENYIFDILRPGLSAEEQKEKIKAFNSSVRWGIRGLCKDNGLPENLSSVWARYSFSTIAVHSGASLAFVQEALGHSSITTTQRYFDGFNDDVKKEISKKLMDF